MKHLRIITLALLCGAFFTSCEKDVIAPDNTAAISKETKEMGSKIPFPLQEFMRTGNLMGASFEKMQLHSKMVEQNYSNRAYSSDITFFDSKEAFNNNTLPIEDFEDVITDGYYSWTNPGYFTDVNYTNSFPSILNENNLHGKFNEGDFTPGISFELELNQELLSNSYWREEYSDEELEEMMQNYGWYIQDYNVTDYNNPENNFTYTKQLFTNYDYTSIVLKFSENSVNSVSFDAPYAWNTIYKIYDIAGNLIATDNTQNYFSVYWGITSKVSIGKIIISYFDVSYFRLDNVSFGNNPDFDNDGVANEDDMYPNSNLSPSFMLFHTSFGIENQLGRNGGTMMDQLESLLAAINAQYNGSNYNTLHRKFTTELAKLSYYWYKDRLITSKQRSAISAAAYSADVPMFVD
ncbi:hypothetical protein [Lutibacter sp.]|uniref:hypothetical protein n=1 Tax=Lutibacter sp. TaxID=1925666 RepID=UPI001A27365A|nr:hypothetical protein [Lutibacter sp.]MBI9041922.1 hypothetical protein [Lutibacter sp.]